jgi:hypothetical protein
MIFSPDDVKPGGRMAGRYCERYADEDTAREGHQDAIRGLRERLMESRPPETATET